MPRKTRAEIEAELASKREIESVLVTDPLEAIRPYLIQAGVEDIEVWFHLYRVVEDGKRADAFLFKCKPEDYDQEILGQTYGSGTYRMKFYVKDDENPHGVVRAAPKFAIEMPPGFKPGPPADKPEPAQGQQTPLTAEAIAAAVANVIVAAMPKALTRAEMLEELRLMADFFKPAQTVTHAPATDPGQALTQALSLISLVRRELPAAEGGGNDTVALVRDGLNIFGDMFKAAKQNATPPAAPVAQLPSTPGTDVVPATPATLPPMTAEEEETMNMLKAQMMLLKGAARAGGDVIRWAENIYADAPQEIIDAVIEGKDPQGVEWFAILEKLDPGVTPLRPWFELLRAKIIEIDKQVQEEIEAEEKAKAGTPATAAP